MSEIERHFRNSRDEERGMNKVSDQKALHMECIGKHKKAITTAI